MKELVLVKTGEANGMPYYQPLDAIDAKTCEGHDTIVANIRTEKAIRTILQNSSLYLYFTMLCDALNSAGWDMKAVMALISKNPLIPWSPEAVKERLWRPIQLATYGTVSTTQLETHQVTENYEALNSMTATVLGVGVVFPNRHDLMDKQLGRNRV